MRTLIVSTGTSLLGNYRKGRQGAARADQAPPAADLGSFLRERNPREASAESNTLEQLSLGDGDRLVWLHSDTEDGLRCAEALDAYFSARGYRGDLRRIEGLGYREDAFAQRGLRALVHETFAAIGEARRRGDGVEICATGGFKAEIAYLNLIGMLAGIPVHYIHEQFRTLITLPALPLHWDLDWVAGQEAFFSWIDDEPRRTVDVESWLRAEPRLRPLVADDAGGYTCLTAAGDLLYRAYRDRQQGGPRAEWPPDSTRSPDEKSTVSDEEHHRPAGWRAFVDRLTRLSYVESVRFDEGGHGRGGGRPRIYLELPDAGTLGILYGRGDEDLPLLVATTARGAPQLALVRRDIESKMRKW